MAESFRCSREALVRGEDLAGTASTFASFLLIEHPGPWGVNALRDAALPEGLGAYLAAAKRYGVRVLLMRRHRGARTLQSDHRVYAAHPGAGWLERTRMSDLRELTAVDLAELGGGVRPGWDRDDRQLFAVCAHGRHDACCAELGRPVASALAAARPDESWEVSHVGGDRFAANVVVLPHGIYYGRVDSGVAVQIAAATTQGHLVLDHVRGRTTLPMPVQYAEIALRRQLGETRIDAVTPTGHTRDAELVTARFLVARAGYEVVVRQSRAASTRLTCAATTPGCGLLFETNAIYSSGAVT